MTEDVAVPVDGEPVAVKRKRVKTGGIQKGTRYRLRPEEWALIKAATGYREPEDECG